MTEKISTEIPIKDIKKILIVRRGAIGDVVLGLPAVHAIKVAYPEIEISWLVHTKSFSAIKDHPDIDHVIELDNNRIKYITTVFQGLFLYFWTLWSLGFKKYDMVVADSNKLSNRLIMRWTGAKYRVMINFSVHRRSFVTHLFSPLGPHLLDGTLQLANILGINITEDTRNHFNIPIVEEDRRFTEKFLHDKGVNEGDVIIGLNPGAGRNGRSRAEKRWYLERFVQLADMLSEQGYKVILFGGKIDKQRVDEITKRLKHPVISAQGNFNLTRLYSLLRQCNVFVTGDTGPMHMAVAVGTPVLALFGPTPPDLAGPVGKQHRSLYFPVVGPNQCDEKEPCGNFNEARHPGFAPITAELVFQNVQEMLSAQHPRAGSVSTPIPRL